MEECRYLEELVSEFGVNIQPSFTESPLLLCGIERGGTGIGARIIGSHTNINSIHYGGSSRFDSFFYQNINRLGEGLSEQIFSKIIMQGREKILSHFNEYSGNTSPYHQAIRAAFSSKNQYACFYNLLALLEVVARSEEIQPFWLDKAIGLGIGDRFMRHFPEGKLIYLLRDPRDILTSQLGIRKQEGKAASRFLVYKLSNIVRNHFREAYQLKQSFGDKVKIIRYEDLVMNPIKTTESIYSNIGIQRLSEDNLSVLNFCQNKASYDRSVIYRGISVKSAYRWKNRDDEGLLQQIEVPLGAWLRKAGYELTDVKMERKFMLKIQELVWFSLLSSFYKYIPSRLKRKIKLLLKQ